LAWDLRATTVEPPATHTGEPREARKGATVSWSLRVIGDPLTRARTLGTPVEPTPTEVRTGPTTSVTCSPVAGSARRSLAKGAMMEKREAFSAERARLNEILLQHADLTTKRFLALDADAYQDGALPRKTKELLGLVASLVLRCEDCITYHVVQAWEAGATGEELMEAMTIALVVGGSIVIPHLRRAAALLDELEDGTHKASRDRA